MIEIACQVLDGLEAAGRRGLVHRDIKPANLMLTPPPEKLSPSGGLIAQWGGAGFGEYEFHWPGDIAADGSGNIYVADTWNDRIVKLSPPPFYWFDVNP